MPGPEGTGGKCEPRFWAISLAGSLEIIYILSLVIPPPSAEELRRLPPHHHRLMSFAAEQTARYNLASYNIEGVRPEDQHDNSLVIWLPNQSSKRWPIPTAKA